MTAWNAHWRFPLYLRIWLAVIVAVDLQRAEAHGLGGRRCALGAAAQDGADARQQLARLEGLGQVVVGAELEADDAVGVLAERAEHDHRHARRREPPAEREAVLARQHQVEHDERRPLRRERAIHRHAVAGLGDPEAVLREERAGQLPDLGVVVDDQDQIARGRTGLHASVIRHRRGRSISDLQHGET